MIKENMYASLKSQKTKYHWPGCYGCSFCTGNLYFFPCICSPSPHDQGDLPEPAMELTDGTYTYTDAQADESGFKNQVSLTVFDGYITSVTWDCIGADGSTKRQLTLDGMYVMTEDGPSWIDQAEAAASYVVSNQSLDGLIDENGYTQAIASVSINLYGFYNAVNECLAQASK